MLVGAQVLGVALDLVNLRSETYTQDSRIPEQTFGTPVQVGIRHLLIITDQMLKAQHTSVIYSCMLQPHDQPHESVSFQVLDC